MGQPVRTKALVLGADGMLGHRIFRELREAYDIEVCGTIRKNFVELPSYHNLYEDSDLIIGGIDAMDTELVQCVVAEHKPDYIINCIGVIKQREEDADNTTLMTKVNQLLPHALSKEAFTYGGKLITFSSDCVFLGDKARPYSEEDEGDAYSLYGRTKYLGEVLEDNALTLRTSFIGFEVKGFTSLLEWFFLAAEKQREEGTPIRGFAQAIWSGVTTRYIAELVLEVMRDYQDLSGLYQVAANPISKFELLRNLSTSFGMEAIIERDDLFIPDKICNRWLSGNVFKSVTGITIPTWDALMQDLVEDYKFYKAHRE